MSWEDADHADDWKGLAVPDWFWPTEDALETAWGHAAWRELDKAEDWFAPRPRWVSDR